MGVTYNGVDLEATFGVLINGTDSWEKPVRDREMVHVPGRNGDLILDNGNWKNVTIEYEFCIKENWKSVYRSITSWLSKQKSYSALVDDVRHPGVYRMASVEEVTDPEVWANNDDGVFRVIFNCKPQQFISNSQDISLNYSSANASDTFDIDYEGVPTLKVTGAACVEFGSTLVEVASFTGTALRIDFETGDAVILDANDDITGSGNSFVTITGDMPRSEGTVTAYHSYDGDTYTGTATISPRYFVI